MWFTFTTWAWTGADLSSTLLPNHVVYHIWTGADLSSILQPSHACGLPRGHGQELTLVQAVVIIGPTRLIGFVAEPLV
jgi:hypothetical protein